MKCYHRTKHADAILQEGFRDGSGTYMTPEVFEGVFLADRPLDENEGASGPVVLGLETPEETLRPYEWIEEGKPYREFCVPAEIVNQYGPPRIFEAAYQGRSRAFVLKLAERWEADGKRERATHLREVHLPFLEKHGLLGND